MLCEPVQRRDTLCPERRHPPCDNRSCLRGPVGHRREFGFASKTATLALNLKAALPAQFAHLQPEQVRHKADCGKN